MSTYYGDAQFPVTRCDDICPFRSSLWTGNWLRAIKRSLWRNTRRQLKDLQSSRDAANRVLSSTVALLEFERWTDFTQWAVGRHLMSHRFRNGVFQWRSVAKTHVYSNSLKLEIFGRSICWKVDERKKKQAHSNVSAFTRHRHSHHDISSHEFSARSHAERKKLKSQRQVGNSQ